MTRTQLQYDSFTIPYTTIQFRLVEILGDTFTMGDNDSGYDDEKPAHRVSIPNFWLAEYQVTQKLWRAVMRDTEIADPFYFTGDQRPAEQISWDDCQLFIDKLNEIFAAKNAADKRQFHFPTETQWEFAARGGKEGGRDNFQYAGSNRLKEVAWYNLNSHRETKPVGLKFSNQLGLYDMSGNVWEWCADNWHKNYEDAPKDGSAWMLGKDDGSRVVRGGSWGNFDYNYRVASRHYWDRVSRYYGIGLRLAR